MPVRVQLALQFQKQNVRSTFVVHVVQNGSSTVKMSPIYANQILSVELMKSTRNVEHHANRNVVFKTPIEFVHSFASQAVIVRMVLFEDLIEAASAAINVP